MCQYLFILKIIVVLWLISVVVECSEKVKRDVHRIIIKERRPRNQKSRHHRHHHHHHDHGHKHPHNHHGSYEHDHSYEDKSKYYSHENSFEDMSAYKSNLEQYKPKPSSPLDFKHEAFRDEWTPLLSSDNKVLRNQNVNSRKRRKPSTHTDSKRYNLPLQIDLTTHYPQKLPYPSLYETNNFPTILDNSYNFNQKIIDSNQSPLVQTGILLKPQLSLSNHHQHQPKNVKENGYEVNESIKDDLAVDEQRSVHSVMPNDNNSQLVVTDVEEVTEKSETKGENVQVEKKKPTRGRGRRYRGNSN